jgi:hypothetical protein
MLRCLALIISISFCLLAPASGGTFIKADLESRFGVEVGDTVEIGLELQSDLALGGIDFTVFYDSTKLRFVEVLQGAGLNNWELFTVSLDDTVKAIQVVAIADIVNGPIHPDPSDFYPHGIAAHFTFVVESAITDPAGSPLEFYWQRCGDNAVSNTEGDSLMVISQLFDAAGQLIWDETDNVNFPESSRPDHIGLPDSCIERPSTIYYLVEMHNGVISSFFICGDTNGDGTVNISDGVFLINFIFAGGPPPQPLAAGDINCDGEANVSDTVYLIQYIFVGGPAPCADCP